MNRENQLGLLETKDMSIVSFDELANILGGVSNQGSQEGDRDKKKEKTKSEESGHAGGFICWC